MSIGPAADIIGVGIRSRKVSCWNWLGDRINREPPICCWRMRTISLAGSTYDAATSAKCVSITTFRMLECLLEVGNPFLHLQYVGHVIVYRVADSRLSSLRLYLGEVSSSAGEEPHVTQCIPSEVCCIRKPKAGTIEPFERHTALPASCLRC